ncbi:energy transducer TonB [Mucilaginibacter ginsenosidivorans]|uniref:Energy transducer TonB n=1 Tax=Mucilaginibacter ginsenosidivorans TaxID=398053 RepID=A0A5B8UXN0_9SPHI|nr:energy transducer TonB [Mucilaginibacter ginsenosidivorans]QEC63156.1 energy transducer TonB [Mucilaginibacter ginsenosidivorans]
MEYQQQEENNYPKAFLATGIIMAVLMAMCYFIVFTSPPPPEMGTGGILVNYGTTDEGMGSDYMSTEEPSKAEKPNHTKPTKITETQPTPQKAVEQQSDKKVVTQNTEDAPEVNSNPKAHSTAVATQPVTKPAKPTLNQNALYKGKSTGGAGEGDGTTNTPGNQGKPTGSTLANNYNGTGSGNGGNLRMDQRSFVSSPKVEDNHRSTGKIVVEIHVDKQGNVISAKAGAKGTTISDYDLFQRCENAVRNAKLNALDTAPDTQIGFVTFVFKVQ